MSLRQEIVSHLDTDYTRPIRDPLWQHIYLSEPLLELIDTHPFRQLSRIKQLGPAYLVYPGATHTRFSHSLGVFHLAKRMMRALLNWGIDQQVSLEGVKSFLAAALLHDLGHFPYTHSFKELPLKEHEALTGELILDEPVYGILRDRVGTPPELVAAIVDLDMDYDGGEELTLFRNILSGTLDPDKLDYLNRDAYFCGVPYGMQDIDFAMSRIRPHARGTALHGTGISAVENILFSKYLMYRAVYWHRTVRVATAMIKKGVYLALEEGAVSPSELYGLDDEQFFLRTSSADHPAFDLIHRVYDRELLQPFGETQFDPDKEFHQKLMNLDYRAEVEERTAQALSSRLRRRVGPESIIIDVPEAVSFEVFLPVVSGSQDVDYSEANTVFTPQVVADFTRTLRKMRLVLEPAVAESVDDPREIIEL
jgi:HD superfamily phosphohydrolase